LGFGIVLLALSSPRMLLLFSSQDAAAGFPQWAFALAVVARDFILAMCSVAWVMAERVSFRIVDRLDFVDSDASRTRSGSVGVG